MPSTGVAPAATPQIRPSRFFANAATTGADLYTSLPHNVWVQRFVLLLQTFAVPFAYYFRPLCTALALFWLVYRATQVLHKPLNELSNLLGFELPATPRIDLAGIKSDGAVIHWTLPEKPRQKKEHKYTVHLNGAAIGSVSIYESAITITGLQPGTFYIVRVALVNNQEFGSKSLPIRFCTKPAASGDYFIVQQDGHETDADGLQEAVPRIRPYRGLKDIAPASPVSAPMAREGSSGLAPRRVSGRRPSPTNLGLGEKHDPQPDDSEAPEGAETIQQLTEKLDALRRENDEAERAAKDEEEEELKQKEDLIKERDELRAEVNEKEKASRNLKREVNTLERQNTAAQNERAKQERLLQQKVQERQKLKDDMTRWERETEAMKEETERTRQDKELYLQQMAQEKEALRVKLAEEAAHVRVLDDEVKEKTSEIKKLERALKNSSPDGSGPEPNLVQQLQNDAEDERRWLNHRNDLQQQYAMTFGKVQAAKRFHDEQMRYLDSLKAERRRQEDNAAPTAHYVSPAQERLPRRGDSQRSRHAASRHSASDSPRLATFGPVTQSPFANNIHPVASGFNSAPFLNIHNGMTLPNPTEEVSLSEEEREKLTGGAMMSPGAGANLLPADLFSGDGDNRQELVRPLPGLGSLPGLPGLPGPPTTQAAQDYPGAGPASPGSASSRSPSVFASPQASQHNLHISSPEGLMDADRRSIRSTRSNRATSGGTSSRFSEMFGIKQRNKNLENGPPLSKSSSMPRQDQGISGLDAATRKRTSSISGTVFQSPGDGPDGTNESPSAAPLGRRAFGFFSKDKSGGWPSSFAPFGRRPTSPRPGSTHSNELPRPSMDSSRWGVDAWPSGDATGGARNSPLAFGQGWPPPTSAQPRMYGSRHPSRRPSVQYGASGPPEDIMEDDDSDALDADHAPHLAPIGTKPPPGSKKSADASAAGGKLNPNAKNFTSFFRFGTKTSSSSKDALDATTPIGSPAMVGAEDDDSPPASRKSRDTRSMTTTESSVLESGRTSSDLARTPSYSNQSDGTYPSPSLAGSSKETFMQKISRKSSSGKFALPTFKRERSRMENVATSAPREGLGEDGDEEGGDLSASVSSLRESKEMGRGGGGGGRSWSSVLKLGKGKKGDASQGVEGEGDEETEEE
ncbi:uncharacterized protein LTR77_004152 [Saxophila tyrrhenica]|uniref:Fibronectin type-III domain-containing protein n=1 Tax=Saxophila tyrrhenica TaxID=1690608 RepID=A0AAV9PFZ3_9PEZI|nr:hypothetical protein LTR77_004152 [Saxophila tyrrhenica]